MQQSSSNIVLIGMPGAGKSTVGVLLAKTSGRAFLDTDTLIETQQQTTLQDIVDRQGHQALRQIEEAALLGLNVHSHVIATGGSAVYSAPAMAHLKASGLVVFLDVTLAELIERVPDFSTRGLAKRPDQSFEDLFAERYALYSKYADMTIQSGALPPEVVCGLIEARVSVA